MTEQEEKPKPKRNTKVVFASKKLLELIASLKPDFRKLKERVDEIFAQAKEEGYPALETGLLIRHELEDHYSERTIQRLLPTEAKANTVAHTHGGGRPKKDDNLSPSEHETTNRNDTTEQEPEAEDEETETEGRENITRENQINFDNYFKIIDSAGKEYAIDTKKLKDVPTDVKDNMIKQLIGGMEFLNGELEKSKAELDKSLKQVEELRKKAKGSEELETITKQRDHFGKTIDEYIVIFALKDKKIEELEKKLKEKAKK